MFRKENIFRYLVIFISVIVATGCSQKVPLSKTKSTNSSQTTILVDNCTIQREKGYEYREKGRKYKVLTSSRGYKKRGIASWYGPNFNGQATACGEIYDMFDFTAAHKTLPMPSYLRVKNLSNGQSVVVKVNDRGPFVSNRIIDLSYAAAKEINMLEEGTAFVELVNITQSEAARTMNYRNKSKMSKERIARIVKFNSNKIYLQIGAFKEKNNALKMQQRISSEGIKNVYIKKSRMKRQVLYRVHIGPIKTIDRYDQIANLLASLSLDMNLVTR